MPMLGAGGSYLGFITGNMSNLKVPVALNAMDSLGIKQGSEEGDVISLAKTGSKKISRFMIDEKIPSESRNIIPLLADGQNIIWIPGYRINEHYKITNKTKRVIEIVWEE